MLGPGVPSLSDPILHFVSMGSHHAELVPCLLECKLPGGRRPLSPFQAQGPAQCHALSEGLTGTLCRFPSVSPVGLQVQRTCHPAPAAHAQEPAQQLAQGRGPTPCCQRNEGWVPGHSGHLPLLCSAGCLLPGRSSATGGSPWTARAQRPTSPAASWARR